VTAAVVVAADQVTKQVALDGLADAPVDVIEGVLTLRLVFNAGGAFGIFQGIPGFFVVATIAICIVILVWARQVAGPAWGIALGMVLGGGLGNVADRIFRDTEGRVVDFIDLQVWPVFNVSDMAIVGGVGLLLLLSFRGEKAEEGP